MMGAIAGAGAERGPPLANAKDLWMRCHRRLAQMPVNHFFSMDSREVGQNITVEEYSVAGTENPLVEGLQAKPIRG